MKGESTEQASVAEVTVIASHVECSCLSTSEFTCYNSQIGNILDRIKFCRYSLGLLVSFISFWITAKPWTSSNWGEDNFQLLRIINHWE